MAPVLAGGLVYISSADSFVHALDARAGTVVTKYPTEGIVQASPVVTADSLHVSSLKGYVYAYNLGR